MAKISISQNIRLKFKPYKDRKFLVFAVGLEMRNTFFRLFTALGAKNIAFAGSKDDVLYEARENTKEIRELQFAVCIITYHTESVANPAYITSLLQSINQVSKSRIFRLPFLSYADSKKTFEQQFGNTEKVRQVTIQAAAKNGLKGLVIGDLSDPKIVKNLVMKIIETIESDEFAKMTPQERHQHKLINSAYAYLNKETGSEEEKENNIKTAVGLFEEVLQQSKDNYDALLGKAMACCKSSDPKKVLDGVELFAKLQEIGEARERVYEGHTLACYKMGKLSKDEDEKQKWLLKGVKSLSGLIEWQLKEHESMKEALEDFQDPELMKKLSNKYSILADSLVRAGGDHIKEAINYYMKGIKMEPKMEGNYKVISILESNAKEKSDFLKIAKVCASARENLTGKEVDFLFREAEAYSKAGDINKTATLYSSLGKYATEDQVTKWADTRKKNLKQTKQDIDRIASLITFLNHRAIYHRRVEKHQDALKDLSVAVSLDIDDAYYDIHFNFAKAIFAVLNSNDDTGEYTKEEGLKYLTNSITICLKSYNLDTYNKLLKAIKDDVILNPYIDDVKKILEDSDSLIPSFFVKE